MMEFTMSRVLMALCGLMIMAVSLGPFSSIYDQRLDQAGMNTVDDVADLFNMISSKGENVSYLIHGYDLLPSPDYYLKIKEIISQKRHVYYYRKDINSQQ